MAKNWVQPLRLQFLRLLYLYVQNLHVEPHEAS
jgi:hypothetical protein